MKKSVGITDDLADVFFIQALQEGYCNYCFTRSQSDRNKAASALK